MFLRIGWEQVVMLKSSPSLFTSPRIQISLPRGENIQTWVLHPPYLERSELGDVLSPHAPRITTTSLLWGWKIIHRQLNQCFENVTKTCHCHWKLKNTVHICNVMWSGFVTILRRKIVPKNERDYCIYRGPRGPRDCSRLCRWAYDALGTSGLDEHSVLLYFPICSCG